MPATSASLAAFALLSSSASATEAEARANPIRKVVTLLQKMQERVIAEGETEKKLFEEFMCQCRKGGGALATSSAAGEGRIPQLAAGIRKTEEEATQNKEDLARAQQDRVAAKTAVAEAGEMRKKEAEAFASTKAEYEANLAAMKKAVAALGKGLAGSFLQSTTAQTVQKLAQDSKLYEDDREKIVAFLSGQAGSDEQGPSTGEVVGILKQMSDEMAAGLKEATETEQAAIAKYQELVAARTNELAALQTDIEARLKRNGELQIQVTQMRNDLGDNEEALEADKQAAAGLEEACKTRTGEYEERSKTRGQELEALADTIKMLNSDEALEMFKKTLPSASASFLQVQVGSASTRARAAVALDKVPQGPRRARIDFIALALRGKSTGFDKVIQMIDNMVTTLKEEQVSDDNKKEECAVQFDHADDQKKEIGRALSDTEKAVATTMDDIATTRDDISALRDGIRNFDRNLAEAGQQRAKETAAYKELMANNAAAKDLLTAAKDRMGKFYGFVQVADQKQQSGGVIDMLNSLIGDLDKEMTEATAEEKNAVAEYENLTKNAGKKLAADEKYLTEKQATKAQLEESLEELKEAKVDSTKELAATNEFIHALHLECDFLTKHFDFRKEARETEIDALGKARDVLNGADYSFLQLASSPRKSLLSAQ